MKKLAIVVFCLLPVVSFAEGYSNKSIELIQEQCAKEQDPVKRQNSCDFLDKQSLLPNSSLPEFHQDIMTA